MKRISFRFLFLLALTTLIITFTRLNDFQANKNFHQTTIQTIILLRLILTGSLKSLYHKALQELMYQKIRLVSGCAISSLEKTTLFIYTMESQSQDKICTTLSLNFQQEAKTFSNAPMQ